MRIPVLDHGYVEFIEAWGHGSYGELSRHDPNVVHRDMEAGIIEAARQSTQGSFRGWDQDVKLLEFLYSHKHFTPFEFAGLVIEVQAPIFVFREWHRHRTQSYNEMSARYAPLPDLYYVPDLTATYQRIEAAERTKNKQAGIAVTTPTARMADDWLARVKHAYKELENIYQEALGDGIPKELARITMPVGHYSRMRASANLRNWLQFLTLRCDPAAQWEIRQFAQAVASLIASTFPRTYDLWNEHDRFQQTQQETTATTTSNPAT